MRSAFFLLTACISSVLASTLTPQVVWFKSPSYQANPQVLQGALDATKAAALNVYTAYEDEDHSVSIWINAWASPSAFTTFISSAAGRKAAKEFAEVVVGVPETTFVSLIDTPEDFYKTVGAPATELVDITVKEGHTITEVIDAMQVMLPVLRSTPGVIGACLGKNLADPEHKLFVFGGYDSVQAHWDAVAEGTPAYDLIEAVKKLANIEFIKHAIIS